ncbi:MAG: FHA domain-containing protein [Phycisphaerales bacterium]
MNVSLVMVTADGKSREVALPKLPATIGRGEECRVRVPLSAVSRKHCELAMDDEEVVIRDLKSSNGTYVNGMKVQKRDLVPGDLIAIGPVVFVLRLNGHPKSIDAKECFAAGMVEPRDQASPSKGGAKGRMVDLGGSSSSVEGMEGISGVPTWGGTGKGEGGKPAAAGAGAKDTKPTGKKSSPGDGDENDESDGLGSLLADLDLSGLDDDQPSGKK